MSKFEIYLVGMIISAVVFCVAVFVLCRKEDEGLFMKILFFPTFFLARTYMACFRARSTFLLPVCVNRKIKGMKYKVGDNVRIISKKWYDEHKDKDGNICGAWCFLKRMSRFCGKTYVIDVVYFDSYTFAGIDIYRFDDYMIECNVVKKSKFLNRNGNYNKLASLVSGDLYCQDASYPSDNDAEIPSLRLDMQAFEYNKPFCAWGEQKRTKDLNYSGCLHFYVDDYRFNSLYVDPETGEIKNNENKK